MEQRADLFRPFAQRRQPHRHHVDPVPEILAEAPGGHLGLEVGVRGTDQPGTKAQDRPAAQPDELALLHQPEQLGLQPRIELADLVEKKRAFERLLGEAGMPFVRAGEGSLLVAEEGGVDQLRCQGGAVDRDERGIPPAARRMQEAGRHLLAGPGLAEQQHRQVEIGHPLQHPPCRPGRRGEAEARERRGLFHCSGAHVVALHGRGQLRHHLVEIEWLGQVVARAGTHQPHRRVDPAIGGHEDCRHRPGPVEDVGHQLLAVGVRQTNVAHHHVRHLPGHGLEGGPAGGREMHVPALERQPLLERTPEDLVVLHHQDGAPPAHAAGTRTVGSAAVAAARSGRRTTTEVPRPERLSTLILPPISSSSRVTSQSPSPF